jgi:hypothetical protein
VPAGPPGVGDLGLGALVLVFVLRRQGVRITTERRAA